VTHHFNHPRRRLSRRGIELVGVNYPDRSTTTILAG
jgi:hypothetical protein